MTQVIVTALYLWLAVTAIALVVWVVKGIRARRATEEKRHAASLSSLDDESPTALAAKKTINLRDPATAPVLSADPRTELQAVGSSTSAAGPATMKASAIARAAQLADRRESTVIDAEIPAAPVRPESPATETPVDDDRREPVEPTTTLADLVRGIQLPHDLDPLPPSDEGLAAKAVTLISLSTSAGEVGASFADELERLGYEIFSVSNTEAVAKRPATGTDGSTDDQVMSLAIRTNVSPRGSSTIGGDAVAIDLWVGAEESPLPAT